MIVWLRICGIVLSTIGAIVLAWRVKGILDALVMAQHANDLNFNLIVDLFRGFPQEAPIIVGMNEQVARQQRRGIWLLVLGFILIACGNALVGLSWYFELNTSCT